MRGKLLIPMGVRGMTRITPADAGKTVTFAIIKFSRHGSPPRMRGKRASSRQCAAQGRITPADAGKTFFMDNNFTPAEDHPRGCGENYGVCPVDPAAIGSPPRMRGKRLWRTISCDTPRITPADAGKTRCSSSSSGTVRDHPRGCGENDTRGNPRRRFPGSPPRMRGKPKLKHG